jgi:hypothetical protein
MCCRAQKQASQPSSRLSQQHRSDGAMMVVRVKVQACRQTPWRMPSSIREISSTSKYPFNPNHLRLHSFSGSSIEPSLSFSPVAHQLLVQIRDASAFVCLEPPPQPSLSSKESISKLGSERLRRQQSTNLKVSPSGSFSMSKTCAAC